MESVQVQANVSHHPRPRKGISILRIHSSTSSTRTMSKLLPKHSTIITHLRSSKNTDTNPAPIIKGNGKEVSEMERVQLFLLTGHHIVANGKKATLTALEY